MATQTTPLQSYELMVIFTPVLAEDEAKAAQQKFTDFITSNGGTITSTEPWGLKGLAYPIAKKTTGLYWVTEFTAPSDLNAKLEIQMNRDESIIRHMITRLDKYALQYNARRRSGVKSELNASFDRESGNTAPQEEAVAG
ncbi:MAG TPA: 30S ribosomal protein S6 [Hymenobacter sp.]